MAKKKSFAAQLLVNTTVGAITLGTVAPAVRYVSAPPGPTDITTDQVITDAQNGAMAGAGIGFVGTIMARRRRTRGPNMDHHPEYPADDNYHRMQHIIEEQERQRREEDHYRG